jgi:pimeloyl-ACP methyl ester carboxylesterase
LKVLHFGPSSRRLLGALHAPRRLRPRGAGVLLCNPFGEEALRAHRIYRVLATQLERSGHHVLRFDYGGTGDSMGDSASVSVEGWLADIALAADELCAATGSRKVVAVGLRLGGTLAALAAARGGLRLRHLVLWDPIVEGAAYLRELATMHRNYMQHEMGAMDWRDSLQVSPDGVPSEALGTPISAALAAELAAIDLAAVELRTDHITVVSTSETETAPLARLRDRVAGSASARWVDLPAGVAWNTDAALNAAVVPIEVVQLIAARVDELGP